MLAKAKDLSNEFAVSSTDIPNGIRILNNKVTTLQDKSNAIVAKLKGLK